jgi:hypothetical protein
MRLMLLAIAAAAAMLAGPASAGNLTQREVVVMCPMIYLPVCASDGKTAKIFPNKCTADKSGFQIVEPAQCGAEAITQGCEEGKPCPVRPRGIGKLRSVL